MSAAKPARPPLTRRDALYAEIEALPPYLKGQIVDGQLIVQPRPAIPHADAATRLTWMLLGPFGLGESGPGGWKILFEPELHLADDVLIPDIAGWRLVDGAPDLLQYAAVPHAPNWLCEVLSPSTARLDRSRKLAIYRREGVDHVWLLDPQTRLLEVFSRHDTGWKVDIIDTTADGAGQQRVEPFDAVPLDFRKLWDAKRSAEQDAADATDQTDPEADAATGEAGTDAAGADPAT